MKKVVMMMFACLFTLNMMADNVRFSVGNMHCDNCAKRVEKALKANEAVCEVKVDLENKAVCVSYDAEKTNVEALQKALTDVKFQVEVAKQCNKKGGCKHEGKEGGCKHEGKHEHKCGKEGKQQDEHKCGAEGCGHNQKKEQK